MSAFWSFVLPLRFFPRSTVWHPGRVTEAPDVPPPRLARGLAHPAPAASCCRQSSPAARSSRPPDAPWRASRSDCPATPEPLAPPAAPTPSACSPQSPPDPRLPTCRRWNTAVRVRRPGSRCAHPDTETPPHTCRLTLPSGKYSSVKLLGTGVDGNQASQTVVVTYTDCSPAARPSRFRRSPHPTRSP